MIIGCKLLRLYPEFELHATMDASSTRASSYEEADEDDGTIVSDTELSDLSDSSLLTENSTNKLSVSGRDTPVDPPESQSLEFVWISSYDKPDPSQKPALCQKRPHIDDWSDGECSPSKTQRGRRQEYTFEDKKAIIDYISQTDSYNKVKGRQLWETMADTKVCPGRTWQSLKEHYKKQIIPNICIFHLPKDIEKRFLAPFPQYRHVHFEDNSLKRPEKEFKKSHGNAGARHVAGPPESFDSADCSDIELSDLSLRKESEIQNSIPPEMSSPGTPDMANEWLSASDKKKSSEDSKGVSEGCQNKFNDIYTEEILKLIGNSYSVERPPNSSSEIDTPKNGPAICSETPELLSSEASTEKEGSVHALETERTQITDRPPAIDEKPLGERSEIESILGLPSHHDGVPKLPVSDVPAEEMREANSTEIEKPQVADRHLTAEERSLDESCEIETISGIPSIDEEALILPIRKRTCLNPQPCTSQRTEQSTTTEAKPLTPSKWPAVKVVEIRKHTCLNPQPCTSQRTEQSTTTGAKPLTPSKWPAIKVVEKSAPNATVRNVVTEPESVPSEEFLFRTKRREYTYEDKKAIVNFISQTQSYNRVKGRQFWQSMVEHKVCPGRTWQSLKEHYIKQIIPNICIFRLSEEEERRFLAPFV